MSNEKKTAAGSRQPRGGGWKPAALRAMAVMAALGFWAGPLAAPLAAQTKAGDTPATAAAAEAPALAASGAAPAAAAASSSAGDASAYSSLDEAALFADGAFDQAVAASQAAGEASKPSVLAGATLVLKTTGTLYHGADDYLLNGTFSGKAFLKATLPDVAQFFISYSMDNGLVQATNDATARLGLAAAGPELNAPSFKLSELYLSFDFAKVVFARVGNQILSWGASGFWSPADFINQAPLDSQAAVDTRAGKSGLRLHLPLPGANFFAFADFSRTINALGQTDALDKTLAAAFRADLTLSPFNIGLNAKLGFDLPPQLGLTVAGSLLGFDLWAEYGMVLPVDAWEYSWAASLGLSRSFGQDNEWNVRAEGFFNGRGQDDAELTPASRFTPFYLGKFYLFLSGSKQKLFAEGTSLSLSGIANLSDLSFTASATLGLNLPKLIPLSFALRYNGGQDNREFTLRTGGAAWSLVVQSVLQF